MTCYYRDHRITARAASDVKSSLFRPVIVIRPVLRTNRLGQKLWLSDKEMFVNAIAAEWYGITVAKDLIDAAINAADAQKGTQ